MEEYREEPRRSVFLDGVHMGGVTSAELETRDEAIGPQPVALHLYASRDDHGELESAKVERRSVHVMITDRDTETRLHFDGLVTGIAIGSNGLAVTIVGGPGDVR